jgi:nitronate monooxygenase
VAIKTRLTAALGIEHPVISAPMAFAAGGLLAAAVSEAGGLGLIGGGYGSANWLREQLKLLDTSRFGCGFITWSVADRPELVEMVLERKPAAIMLSFGDPAKLSRIVTDAGVRLICQVQCLEDVRVALDNGASIIVAQGAEAGGHGQSRATMTLVPEVADLLAGLSPATLLCAAGGIADGRGLAASLMLGADGVLIGSRFWASTEALVHPNFHATALEATGDNTIRSTVMDIVRHYDWPNGYTARVLSNQFTERWHGHESELTANAAVLDPQWVSAWNHGDTTVANVFVGEAVGIIDVVKSARQIMDELITEAEARIACGAAMSEKTPPHAASQD